MQHAKLALNDAANPTVTLTGPHRAELRQVDIRQPGAGEVLIKTHVSLISSGTEMTMIKAEVPKDCAWAEKIEYPRPLGYSNVGTVLAVGEGVDPDLVGKRVHTHAPHQAYSLVTTAKLAQVPEGVDDESAAFSTLATVGMNAFRRAQVTWGESVGVVGLGIIGQLLVRLSVVLGARPVIGLDPVRNRVEKLPDHGAVEKLVGRAPELVEEVRSRNRQRLLDVVVEASGNPQAVAESTALLRIQGRLVIAGSPSGPTTFDFHDGCNRNSFTIVGAHGFSHPPEETYNTPWSSSAHASLFMDYVRRGEIQVADLVSHRIPGAEATRGYELLRENADRTLGLIIDWTG